MVSDPSSAKLLIEAALPIFGRSGLEGASTRAIASAAAKPMSAITYHFGGKEGLYLACARHISDTIGGIVGAVVVETAGQALAVSDARQGLGRLLAVLVAAITRDETAPFARFIMREQQEPTAAFDIIYGGMMGQLLSRMTALMTVVAAGRISDAEIRVRVIALMGQAVAFRVARAATQRLTGWADIGDAERALIARVIDAHLTAILDHIEQEQQP